MLRKKKLVTLALIPVLIVGISMVIPNLQQPNYISIEEDPNPW